MLKPLTKSSYTVESTNMFINKIQQVKIPDGYEMVSFDVCSLFTNVPLDFTVDLILDLTYNQKKVNTDIPKESLRTLLLLCTKNIHFAFNGKLFVQIDGAAMGSPLGPVLAKFANSSWRIL